MVSLLGRSVLWVAIVVIGGFAALKYADSTIPAAPWHTPLELYPYDGFHNRASFRYIGEIPNEEQPDQTFDYQWGSHGFFVDFDLTKPPEKASNEIRVGLIGGSGAMGHGATTNDKMLYRRLESILNESYAGSGVKIRVTDICCLVSYGS
jgi:hypothetical protein